MMSVVQCIYIIRNLGNGKIYVGSTTRGEHRFMQHKTCLRGGRHTNPKLQHAWKFHGEQAFRFEVLESVEGDKEVLEEREQHYIDTLKPEYNCKKKAVSTIGAIWDAESKERFFAARRGVPVSPEVRAKIAAHNRAKAQIWKIQGCHPKPTLGKKWTAEERARLSAARMGVGLGRKMSEAGRAKCSAKVKAWLAEQGPEHTERLRERAIVNFGGRVPTQKELARKSDRMKAVWAQAKKNGTLIGGRKAGRKPRALPKTCVQCGGDNPVRIGRQKTCSPECGKKYKAAQLKAKKYNATPRICVECGTHFEAAKARPTVTCSKRCAALRWRRSQREAA